MLQKYPKLEDRMLLRNPSSSPVDTTRMAPFVWLSLVFYSCCISVDAVFASRQCLRDPERTMLLELKDGLVFDPLRSTKLVTWGRSFDSWGGVTCEGGRVVGLDLSNESISDGINSSSSLFKLQQLRALNLAFNLMNQSGIPSEFAGLSNLVYLNLSNAAFGGQIPIAISRLTRLVTLDLSTVYVPHLITLRLEHPNLRMLVGSLTNLKELHLDGVNISLPGSEWCDIVSSSLPKLEVLSMFDCRLSGPIDSSLLHLRSLSVIRLGRNKLSTRIPEFIADFPNLTSLSLSYAGLHGELSPKIIQSLNKLKTLDLSYNSHLSVSLPEFPENSALQTLIFSFTGISGKLPDSIGNLENLSRIEMTNCSISGWIPSSMANLSKLVNLDLSFNYLTGPVPSFSKSKNLTEITLSHNDLTGEITSTRWEYLKKLVNVNLKFNSLSGRIPSSLLALPSIQKIELASNKFSGQLPEFSSSQLDTLELNDNRLEGPVPMSIFGLQRLKLLLLSSNSLTGSLDLHLILRNSSLSYLDLSQNKLSIYSTSTDSGSGSFPQMGKLLLASCRLMCFPALLSNQTSLISLDLSDNNIEGSIPKWISNLGNLVDLNLSYNLLQDKEMVLHNLSTHQSLITLDVHSNKLAGQLPPLPPSAIYLDYSSNNFSSSLPDDIGTNISYISFFSLAKNNLHGPIPESICQFVYLIVLDLSNNFLTGPIPTCIRIPLGYQLEVLNLRNNSLHGRIPDSFPGACALKSLDLSLNQFEGQLPISLSNCGKLEVLDIRRNCINDTFPCQLRSISSLRVLVLRSNQFRGRIGCHGSCGAWDKLQIVDLADNDFDGELPGECLAGWSAMKMYTDADHIQVAVLKLSGLYYQETVTVTIKGLQLELVKILKAFTSIDFSRNRIEGPIPEAFGDLKALHLLNLSHNALNGTIPSSLVNMQALEGLDLSWNILSGRIPPELSDLNFLSALNLSHNQLVGSIPASKQFLTFTASSYGGNAGLCGPPLSQSCSNSEELEKEPTNRDQGPPVSYWHFMILGYGGGAGAAIAALTVWSRGGRWLDAIVAKILVKVLSILKS